jgi:hypothetical protein
VRIEQLYDLGFSIIPLKPKSKQPATHLLPNGRWGFYSNERASLVKMQWWFGNTTNEYNVGIVLGKISGVVVVESDSDAAEAWCACASNLPTTPMQTVSRRGRHRFYRYPRAAFDGAPIPAALTPDGLSIEVKRDGQYVLAPGSVHPSGHVYACVGDWPASILDIPEFPSELMKREYEHTDSVFTLPDEIAAGERHMTLFKLTRSLRAKGAPFDETLHYVQRINQLNCKPPLPISLVTREMSRAYHQPNRPEFEPLDCTLDDTVPSWIDQNDTRGKEDLTMDALVVKPKKPKKEKKRTIQPVLPDDPNAIFLDDEQIDIIDSDPDPIDIVDAKDLIREFSDEDVKVSDDDV